MGRDWGKFAVSEFQELFNVVLSSNPKAEQNHKDALANPNLQEAPIVLLLKSWLMYADQNRSQFGNEVGNGTLGSEWGAIGTALSNLLTGETGRLHCRTIREVISQALSMAGIDDESNP